MNQQPKLNTFVRVRPPHREIPEIMNKAWGNSLEVSNQAIKINHQINDGKNQPTTFQIPQIFGSHQGFITQDGKNVGQSEKYSGQEDVYKKISLNVQRFLNGERQAVVTTGACGGGKSYTMFGDQLNQGVFYQFCQELFQQGKQLNISIIQLANNKIVDVLEGKNININEEKKKIIVTNLVETFDLIQKSISKQSFITTMMNSNRFIHHTFVYVNLVDQPQSEAIFGDLSSSERIIGDIPKERLREVSEQNESIMLFHQQLEQLYAKYINSKQQIVYSKKILNKIIEEVKQYYKQIVNSCHVDIIFCVNVSYLEYNETYNILKLAEMCSKIQDQENQIPKLDDAELQMIQEEK